MAVPPAEFTVICIDNAMREFLNIPVFDAQIEAMKFYCETIFKCNPRNIVSIFTISSLYYGDMISPTSDLQKILCCLQDVRCPATGLAEFEDVVVDVCSTFYSSPPNMKRRLLMFVAGPVKLQFRIARSCGKRLKGFGVALDVFNFFSLKIDPYNFANRNYSILRNRYHYARAELDVLVTTANDNDNSHILDVVDESSVRDALSKSILKKHLHYLEKKAAAADVEASQIQFDKPELERFHNEKNKSAADDESPVIEYGNLSKKSSTPHISGKKKAEENGNVKQELERAHNEKNKSGADDEECVQAPGMEYVSKKTPRKKKNKTKC